jgi:hypothetical protein
VAYVYAEYTPYELTCVSTDLGTICTWNAQTPVAVTDYVANATPYNVTNPANWPRSDTPAAQTFGDGYLWAPSGVARLLVRVCVEQWRYEPNRVIACSAWQ